MSVNAINPHRVLFPTIRGFIDNLPEDQKRQILLYDYYIGREFFNELFLDENKFVSRFIGNLAKFYGLNRAIYVGPSENVWRVLYSKGFSVPAEGDIFDLKVEVKDWPEMAYFPSNGASPDLYFLIRDRDGRLKRVLALDDTKRNTPFDAVQIAELAMVAGFLSKFIAQKLVFDDTRMKDPLTGAFNRNALYESTEEDIKKISSLVIIDVDNFKITNDTHGHEAGDELLVKLVAHVKSHIRLNQGDRVVRYGGEEFVVLFTDLNYSEAVKRMENILEVFVQKHGISFSGGMVRYDQTKNLDRNISAADKLLYDAKHTGKAKIVSEL